MAILSVVLGAVSTVFSLIVTLGMSFAGNPIGGEVTMYGAPIAGVIGLVVALISRKDNNSYAKLGLLLSVLGVILSVVMFLVVLNVYSTWDVS